LTQLHLKLAHTCYFKSIAKTGGVETGLKVMDFCNYLQRKDSTKSKCKLGGLEEMHMERFIPSFWEALLLFSSLMRL